VCLGQIDCYCSDGDAEARQEAVVQLPCVRCGTSVAVPKEDIEEDPQGLVTCDECWPIMQAEMFEGVPQHSDIVDDSLPL
jgi:uncharacterized Zn finger protein